MHIAGQITAANLIVNNEILPASPSFTDLGVTGTATVAILEANYISGWAGAPVFERGLKNMHADGIQSNNYKTRDGVAMFASSGAGIVMYQDVTAAGNLTLNSGKILNADHAVGQQANYMDYIGENVTVDTVEAQTCLETPAIYSDALYLKNNGTHKQVF